MTKTELIDFITNQNECSKAEAERAITLFTNGIISAVSEGNEVNLIGFGSFTISQVAARAGINPKTKEPLQIDAYKQVRFKVGQKLKDAANNSKKSKSGSVPSKSNKKNVNKAKVAKTKK